MGISAIGQYQAVPGSYAPQREGTIAAADGKKTFPTGRDTVELSGKLRAERRGVTEKLLERVREGNRETAGKPEELPGKAEETGKVEDESKEEKESEGDRTGTSGRVGINAAKLARMLAAAKTRSQVQAVIAKIRADLEECEAGKAQGMDVDEASVEAAEQLLQEAKSRLGSAENREATPQEEMAAMLASLM